MKKRATRIANFFAFNVLFFALYLNFIHKEQNVADTSVKPAPATVTKAEVVNNLEQYLNPQASQSSSRPAATSFHDDRTAALKLAIN